MLYISPRKSGIRVTVLFIAMKLVFHDKIPLFVLNAPKYAFRLYNPSFHIAQSLLPFSFEFLPWSRTDSQSKISGMWRTLFSAFTMTSDGRSDSRNSLLWTLFIGGLLFVIVMAPVSRCFRAAGWRRYRSSCRLFVFHTRGCNSGQGQWVLAPCESSPSARPLLPQTTLRKVAIILSRQFLPSGTNCISSSHASLSFFIFHLSFMFSRNFHHLIIFSLPSYGVLQENISGVLPSSTSAPFLADKGAYYLGIPIYFWK